MSLVGAFKAGNTHLLSLLLDCLGCIGIVSNDPILSRPFSGLSLTELLSQATRTHLLSKGFPGLLKQLVDKGALVILSSPKAVAAFLSAVQAAAFEANKLLVKTLLSLPTLSGEPIEVLLHTLSEENLSVSEHISVIDLLPELPVAWPPEVGASHGKAALTSTQQQSASLAVRLASLGPRVVDLVCDRNANGCTLLHKVKTRLYFSIFLL